MRQHKRNWSTSEKLEVLDFHKSNSLSATSRQFDVSTTSIRKWKRLYDQFGVSGLSGEKKEVKSDELARLKRENEMLKALVAEKELELRIKNDMLKKSR